MTPIEILHDALLDGGLDAAQQAELRQRLADPEQRRAWRRLATFSGRIGEELSADGVALVMPLGQPTRRQARPRRWPVLAAAAAVLAIGTSAWWAMAGRAASADSAVVITGGVLRTEGETYAVGSELPVTVALVGDGEGSLALADGSTCAWSGPLTLRCEGPRRLALDRGDVRVAVPSPRSDLTMVTAFATATATGPGARFRVRHESTVTRFGVAAGTVTVVAGDQRVVLGAGHMLTAGSTGLGTTSALTPPTRWGIKAGEPGWGGEDFLGVMDGAAVRPQSDPTLPTDDPRRFIQAGADYPPGMVGVSPSAVVRTAIRAERAGPMAVILICKDSFTGEYLGNVVAYVDLVGGGVLQPLEIPLSDFSDPGGWTLPQPGERETPAAIYSVILQWWGDDLGSRVESIAIEP